MSALRVGGTSKTGPMSIPFPPGTEQHDRLDSVIAELDEVERRIRALDARKSSLLAEVARLADAERDRLPSSGRSSEMVHRVVAAEVGFALGIADRSAERMIHRARVLCAEYPVAHAALAEGRIGIAHATALSEAGAIVEDPAARAAYSSEALAVAENETPNRTRRLAKILAEKYAVRSMEEHHKRAHEERRVWVVEIDDGMAELHTVMDAVSAHAIFDRITRQASVVCRGERAAQDRAIADPRSTTVRQARTLDQARADLLADVLLNGDPSGAWSERGDVGLERIDARVQVTVPMSVLTGEEPESAGGPAEAVGPAGTAVLAGHGAIDGTRARLIAGLAKGWDRVAVHSETGEVLAVDRYRPSEEIRRFIRARDQHCRFPGCSIVPFRTDSDHTFDAALGGETSTENMAILCRRHHMMKHHGGIEMTQHPGGEVEWRTPLGQTHRSGPASRVMFRPVAQPRAA